MSLFGSDEPYYADEADHGLSSFTDWRVRVFAPPVIFGLAWAANAVPITKFFLTGFHVWMHEFGHATAAWLCGYQALPLPFGWTSLSPAPSTTVYYLLLFIFGVLGWFGWQQRRPMAVALAVGLAIAQFFMSWRASDQQHDLWIVFGGVGGTFYLSALLIGLFFVRLPAWFRWGACRYFLFFLAASTLLDSWHFWEQVYRGIEEIPFGSMIHGEEDANGDMNRLMSDHGWTMREIRRTFHLLGIGSLLFVGACYAFFAARADRIGSWFAREPDAQAAE